MVMVKPALPYLDVIRAVRDRFDLPLAAYNVSGEYAMVKAAAAAGDLDERAAAIESLTADSPRRRRPGADLLGQGIRAVGAGLISSPLWHRAKKVIPGGVNSPVRAMRSVGLDEPFFVERGEGAFIETADGRVLLDWVQSWGPLIFGHGDRRDGRGGARGGTRRNDLRRSDRTRGRARSGDRRRRAVGRTRPAGLVGHGSGHVRRAARARVHAPRPRDQVRGLLSRARRSVPGERRIRSRDARDPGVAGRADRHDRGHDRLRVQRRRRSRCRGRAIRRGARGDHRRAGRRQHGLRAAARRLSGGAPAAL